MSVTYPKGFMAAGISCGLKKDKKDLALVVNTGINMMQVRFSLQIKLKLRLFYGPKKLLSKKN